ncbi:MAG: LTA synthase family protein [Endomicrobium sp.]|jgi:phosphoglycerol transferase MdoB-like AlkP superfamily enzyme|nr:LTA synthase family protein [Endomicrobium sp.]
MLKKYNFEKYFDCFIKIIPLNAAVILAMTVYRVWFFFYFSAGQSFSGFYWDVLRAFWLGFRFDLSVLAYINALPALIFTLFLLLKNMRAFKIASFFTAVYFWFAFMFILFLNFVDIGFFTYFHERINLLLFDFFLDDTSALLATIIKDVRFYEALALFLAAGFALYKLCRFVYKNIASKHCIIAAEYWNVWVKTVIVLTVVFLTFLFARGTVSMFPLGTFYTQISPNAFLNKISISSLHSLFDAISAKSEQSKDKIDIPSKLGVDKENIDLSVFGKITAENHAASEIKPNVVFIILESFGELPVLYNGENFNVLGNLKKHFDEDIVLYNFLAAGKITINALESTILNMPQRPFGLQITQSPKAFYAYPSSVALPYKKAGYLTKAVYGGSLSWRGLETFLKAQGFDKLYGEGSIKNEYRHQWGINDKQFFEMLLRELKADPQKPKFIYALSTATHPPYETPPYFKPLPLEIPKELKETMPEEKNVRKIFETYQFANICAAEFLDAVKNSELAQNTIIAITGDHNLREIRAKDEKDLFKKYAVPLYLYIPQKLKKPFNARVAGSHIDIAPTLYELSLSSQNYYAAGESLAGENKEGFAFNGDGFILSGDKAVLYNVSTGKTEYFDFDFNTKMLKYAESSNERLQMLERYKKTLAASDVYLRQADKKGENK